VKLMRKLLKKHGFAPTVLMTDKLRSYGAARSESGLAARHEQGLRRNNRAENSHQLVRRRERRLSGSSRPDQHSGSCLFTPLSTTLSTFSAIPLTAARFAPSKRKPCRRGIERHRRHAKLTICWSGWPTARRHDQSAFMIVAAIYKGRDGGSRPAELEGGRRKLLAPKQAFPSECPQPS
jgi:hypothetical protein